MGRIIDKVEQQEKFIRRASEIHVDVSGHPLYDYGGFEYVDYRTPGVIKCIVHNHYFKQSPNKHISKMRGCPECGNIKKGLTYKNKKSKTFINRALAIHGDRYDYSECTYSRAHNGVDIICKRHGLFVQIAHDHLSGHGCPLCNISHLERDIELLLSNNNIRYIRECKFTWLKNPITNKKLKLDFYLPDHKMAIECQGGQHFKPIDKFGGVGGLKKIIDRDQIKQKLCVGNNITIIYYTKEKNKYNDIYNKENTFTNINKLLKKIICQIY